MNTTQIYTPAIPQGQVPYAEIERAARLDRESDALLQQGRHRLAEHLAFLAESIRQGRGGQ
jgi:hypothetical protein